MEAAHQKKGLGLAMIGLGEYFLLRAGQVLVQNKRPRIH